MSKYLLIALALLFVACGDSSPTEPVEPPPPGPAFTLTVEDSVADGLFFLAVERWPPTLPLTGEFRWTNGGVAWSNLEIDTAGVYRRAITHACFLAEWTVNLWEDSIVASRSGEYAHGDAGFACL